MVLVEKCGIPEERGKPKAGNRGKRDSQFVLMSFFSNVTFNDRMCPLNYELFWKIQRLTGRPPSIYELVCMVDADTFIMPDALKHMVFNMEQDEKVIGQCGETTVANKWKNWVTWIQASLKLNLD